MRALLKSCVHIKIHAGKEENDWLLKIGGKIWKILKLNKVVSVFCLNKHAQYVKVKME